MCESQDVSIIFATWSTFLKNITKTKKPTLEGTREHLPPSTQEEKIREVEIQRCSDGVKSGAGEVPKGQSLSLSGAGQHTTA